jgi:hypothetical protein
MHKWYYIAISLATLLGLLVVAYLYDVSVGRTMEGNARQTPELPLYSESVAELKPVGPLPWVMTRYGSRVEFVVSGKTSLEEFTRFAVRHKLMDSANGSSRELRHYRDTNTQVITEFADDDLLFFGVRPGLDNFKGWFRQRDGAFTLMFNH